METPLQTLVRKRLEYDPLTGYFTRKISEGKKVRKGNIAGGYDSNGYIEMSVAGVRFKAHRLAFIWMTGVCPKEVDHINGNRADNKWENLREVTRSTNCENQRTPRGNNKFLGVSCHKRGGKNPWKAEIKVEGKRFYLGTFSTPEAAYEAYKLAKRILHEGCTL